jgi:hypothetical protein
MPLDKLPYDMGNAADLLKHGLLAEFTRWWSEDDCRSLRYLDPFAGRPWVSPNPEVARRVLALPPCALRNAQPHPAQRYYGSSWIVLNTARSAGAAAEIWFSDSNPKARDAFSGCDSSFGELKAPGFRSTDGFSVLSSDIEADLLLLDPFPDFLPKRAANEIPRIANTSNRIACVLLVMNLNPANSVGQQYSRLRSKYLPTAWSLHCPKLRNTGVRGESGYEVEVLLAWRPLADHPRRTILLSRLRSYADALSGVLNTRITFSPHVQGCG